MGNPEERRFLVALSFPGERRPFVEKVAEALGGKIGHESVFYDAWYESELARPNLDTYLQDIYGNQSLLVVPFFCAEYERKKWCNVEWRVMRAALMSREHDATLMPMRFDDTAVPGFLPIDGYVSIRDRSPEEIADLILKRLSLLAPEDERLSSLVHPVHPVHNVHSVHPAHPVHNLPFSSIGSLFKGRDADLKKLDRAEGPVAITQAIRGLGGVGKTRLAVEIGWRAVETGTHRHVLFATADSPQRMRANLAALTRALDLPERDTKEEPVQTEAVLRWFESHDNWLLILDNADSADAERAVRALLPRLKRGRVLITSRRHGWAGCAPLDLETMDDDPATEFLLEKTAGQRSETPNDATQARTLAREFGGLPLALEQAGAYIARTRGTFSEYLKAWECDKERVLERDEEIDYGLPDDESRPPGDEHGTPGERIPRSVLFTWRRTFDVLSPAARTMLRLASHLAPDPIPIALFERQREHFAKAVEGGTGILPVIQESGTGILPVRHEQDAHATERHGQDAHATLEALGELVTYSMATREAETFEVHCLVQEVVRLRIPEPERRAWLYLALSMVNADCTGDPSPEDVRSWGWWGPTATHVEAISRLGAAARIAEPTAWLTNALGVYLKSRALFFDAETVMRRALEIGEKVYGPDSPRVAAALDNLAQLLEATNRRSEAEELIKHALEIDKRAFGPDHPNVAMRLNTLALLLKATNRVSEAESLYRRALGILERALGDDHPKVAAILSNLGGLLVDVNRMAEAEPYIRRALEIDEASYGPDHPNVARDINNLAALLKATNNLSEAELFYRRALEIWETALGHDHPRVGTALNNLAILLQETNRLLDAESLMRRVIQIDESSFGPDHPHVARDLNNLAVFLQATNRVSEVEELMRRALKIDDKFFGSDHPKVAIRLNNLAAFLWATNRLAESEPLYRRAFEIDEKAFGPDHPAVACSLNVLGALEMGKGNPEEAKRLSERALAIFRKSYGDDHPNTRKAQEWLDKVKGGL